LLTLFKVGSPDTLPVPFSHDWEGLLDQERDGYRYADEEWSQLFPAGGGSVALTSDFIQQHGIAANAAPTPEDPDKRIYLIAGYHQLHCLVSINCWQSIELGLPIIPAVSCARLDLLLERHFDRVA